MHFTPHWSCGCSLAPDGEHAWCRSSWDTNVASAVVDERLTLSSGWKHTRVHFTGLLNKPSASQVYHISCFTLNRYEKTEDASEKTSLADQEDARLIFINQPQFTKFCNNRVRYDRAKRFTFTGSAILKNARVVIEGL
ncbi:phospholipid-transporting ATPase IA isoform X1 [Tachysurus ichikawai]